MASAFICFVISLDSLTFFKGVCLPYEYFSLHFRFAFPGFPRFQDFIALLVTPMMSSASDQLETFCLLAKSTKGVGACSVILQVINAKKIFVFGEFLNMDNIQAVGRDILLHSHYIN